MTTICKFFLTQATKHYKIARQIRKGTKKPQKTKKPRSEKYNCWNKCLTNSLNMINSKCEKGERWISEVRMNEERICEDISEIITQSIAPGPRLKIWKVKSYGAWNKRSNIYLIRVA